MNAHDLEAFLACIHPEYRSEQPVHPERGFGGRDQVEKNWAAMFSGIPDFRAETLDTAVDGDTAWTNGVGAVLARTGAQSTCGA